jgi:hypothetical protein
MFRSSRCGSGAQGVKVKRSDNRRPRRAAHSSSRFPENSRFYDKLLPALLVLLAIIMVILILFAVGVLVGLVPFNGAGGVAIGWLNL